LTNNLSILTPKIVTKLSSWVGSGIRKKFMPDPGSGFRSKNKSPNLGSVTLVKIITKKETCRLTHIKLQIKNKNAAFQAEKQQNLHSQPMENLLSSHQRKWKNDNVCHVAIGILNTKT
jgi:hypothetical protein